MDNQKEKLVNDIRSIFYELIEEEDVRFDEKQKRTIYPRSYVYVDKANKLYAKAVELEKIDSSYSTHELKSVFNKEIYFVKHHKYKYDDGQVTQKSLDELHSYMHNTTYQVKLSFYGVLGDIKID